MKSNINKRPGLAAIFSTIFPGAGFFYLGNYMRGFVHLGIFIFIVGILNSPVEQNGVIFGLLLGGTYFFQIFDAYNYGCKLSGSKKEEVDYSLNIDDTNKTVSFEEERLSLTGSVIILILGITMQLVNLDIINFRYVFKYWPILLIAIGIKLIFQSNKGGKDE